MSVRLAFPRYTPSLVLRSTAYPRQNIIPYCLRALSVSTHEQPKHTIVPQSPVPNSLRETKRPETLHVPPAPPRNDPAPASSISTPTDQPLPKTSPPTTSPESLKSSPQHPVAAKSAPKFAFKPLKAALILTPAAISRLKDILDQPSPKLVRVGVKNKGCAGMAYHLEYVDKAGKFDEVVEQDGVKVLVDAKALFSIIGSKMDFVEDRLSARFVFENPHVKGSCGCGESFSVA